MRVIVDRQLPWSLVGELHGRGVTNLRGLMRMSPEAREKYLQDAARSGRDVLVTADEEFGFYETLTRAGLAVVVLEAHWASVEDFIPRMPDLVSAISRIRSGQAVRVAA